MKTVTIPNTTLNPSCLCLGTNRFGTVIEQADAFGLLDAFVEAGGNFIDTAHVYANWIPNAPQSASEKTIGRWLKASGKRDQMVIATKGGHPYPATMHIPRLSGPEIIQDIEESLRYLQTDVLDLFWLHRDAPEVPVADIIETLNEQVQAGTIRYFGCSNWQVDRIKAANVYAATHNLRGFVANQPWWSLAHPNRAALSDPDHLVVFGEAEMEFHHQTGMAVIPYSAQGKGFFSKLKNREKTGLSEADYSGFYNQTNLRRRSRVEQLAQKYQVPVSHIVLSYLLSQPFVTIPIIGCRTLEQLQDSTAAAGLELSPEALAAFPLHI